MKKVKKQSSNIIYFILFHNLEKSKEAKYPQKKKRKDFQNQPLKGKKQNSYYNTVVILKRKKFRQVYLSHLFLFFN